MKRPTFLFGSFMAMVVMGVIGAPSAWADPTFDISPNPLTGNAVTFTYTGTGTDPSWDLDGDGQFNDAFGATAHRTYRLPGRYTVGLQDTAATTSSATASVLVNGPSASFVGFPETPVVGQQVTLVYSPTDPVSVKWDLNGDGKFEGPSTTIASTSFPAAGMYPVSVRVTDGVSYATEAVSTGTQFINVVSPATAVKLGIPVPKPKLMTPFPVVRITGKLSSKGARIKKLTVKGPFGATITVRCRGRGCPFKRATKKIPLSGSARQSVKTVRIKRLERRLLRGGVTLKVTVARPGEIGKYTRFRIRKGKPPTRDDSCVLFGSSAPTNCPSS